MTRFLEKKDKKLCIIMLSMDGYSYLDLIQRKEGEKVTKHFKNGSYTVKDIIEYIWWIIRNTYCLKSQYSFFIQSLI